MKKIYEKYICGDMCAVYLMDTDTNICGLTLLPAELAGLAEPEGWWAIEPVVQLKAIGDGYPDGFSNGHTMRNSPTAGSLKFREQLAERQNGLRVITIVGNEKLEARHILEYGEGDLYLKMYTQVISHAAEPVGIEMLSSYNLCGFSCLGKELRTEDFVLHRMLSKWSMEGRLVSTPFPELQLEPAWSRIGANSVRFGQVGSMPVRRYFPWMVAEDKRYGYGIGIQLCHPCSWQMEVYNRDERVSFSGGLADREFGHWMKYLEEGEIFQTPEAIITVAMEDVDGISHCLTLAQLPNLERLPEAERELPVVFNEFCTSWGSPTQQEMLRIVEALKGRGIRYCVIDAGWHVKDGNEWSDVGDWVTNQNRFPDGLESVARAIKQAGMIPGIWYEMENAGSGSDIFYQREYLLERDGYPLQAGSRRFLDFRKEAAWDYLEEKVIAQIQAFGFGYLKVDYNDNIGIGCDGAESLGEGLRQQMGKVQAFWEKIRRDIPELVIENCSSGGHRLEPSMMRLCSMASFSDAHECRIIPIIAANVARAILPAQSQIWAVLRGKDDEQRLYYSLCNTFLGRMCLSGDVCSLEGWQWEIVERSIQFYKECAPVIRNGRNYRLGTKMASYNHPEGWQAVCRAGGGQESEGRESMMVVLHSFEEYAEGLAFALPQLAPPQEEASAWAVTGELHREGIHIRMEGNRLIAEGMKAFDAAVVLLKAAVKL